jgi:hypothetical protein
MGYLLDRSGNEQVLDIPGISYEVFGISVEYPKIKKLGMGYPKSTKDIPNLKSWNGISQNQ